MNEFAEHDPSRVLSQMPEEGTWVYYAQAGHYPSGVRVIDYDVSRLRGISGGDPVCAEMADLEGVADRVVINLPRFVPYEQTERDLSEAARRLAPQGELTLLVPRRSGERRWNAVLETRFEEVEVDRKPWRARCRAPRTRTDPGPIATRRVEYVDPVTDRSLEFETRPGLFSVGEVDPGSRLLLEQAQCGEGQDVLDTGCGWGLVGAAAAARGARPVLVDCDVRATKLAASNLERNGLAGEVRLLDRLDDLASASFDVVLSNPPTHAGSEVLRALFDGMVRVCRPGGVVWSVVREQLNYEKWLSVLGELDTPAQDGGFKILRVRR